MIPKIIHYCWFGGSKKSDLILKCINSWKEKLPDFEIIEWNESNTDLTNPFITEVYKLKKWAFVADYVRLTKVYIHGGCYLDTDMLVLKDFNDLMLEKFFIGAENNEFVNSAIFGAEPNHPFLKKCLEVYDRIIINKETDLFNFTITRIITKLLKEDFSDNASFEFKINNNQVTIYPSQFFYSLPYEKAYDYKNYQNYITNRSIAVHLWDASWIKFSEFKLIERREYVKGFKLVFLNIFFKNEFSINYLKSMFYSIKESFRKLN